MIHNVDARLSFDRHDWVQVSNNVAFQRNYDLSMDSKSIKNATDNAINRILYSSEMETDPYQMAWHLLGFYVDCNSTNSYGKGCNRNALFAVVSSVVCSYISLFLFTQRKQMAS